MRAFKWIILAATLAIPLSLSAANNQILGWNNLGMHCMDSDYSVFSILPPYNTIEAQLIVNGKLVTNGVGYTVTYQAVADPTGSINKSSIGKGNWLQYAPQLFGAVAGDQGLPFPSPVTFWMPGVSNTPQSMVFEQTNEPAGGVLTPVNWFHAYGIPITPYDDAGRKNPYPMMRQIAKSGTTPIATNDIVLPVSDEMDCRICHASGSQDAAKPVAGWVWSGIQERDFRLNILRLHDEHQFAQHHDVYVAALAAKPGNGKHFNPQGLYRSVVVDNQPVLCAACHASEALGGGGYAGIPPLTTSIHSFHAHVIDPLSNTPLDNAANRSACYRCHPGSTTRCLRGAMGGAIATDGSMEMQCQSCHGNMSTVGSPSRVGWFMEPNCASCHTGTAKSNNGQICYTSVFTDTNWTVRVPTNQTFSTQSNIPAAGISLYRFSAGHGGLQCAACHGSTHAEFPSTHANDNVRNTKLQGHAGVMVECTACHVSMSVSSTTAAGGPHGMHPIGSSWVSAHHDYINGNLAACQACHGTDNRGTVLSRVQDSRTLTASLDGGTVTSVLFRGATIGCYSCHKGPSSSSANTNAAPTVSNITTNTSNDQSVTMMLPATGTSLTLRIISQPANGAVGLSNNIATYFPNPGFVGSDTFTFAAYDGAKNSNLATGTVAVVQGPYSLGATAHVPTNYPAGWPAPFAIVPTVTNNSGPVTFSWNFGDSSLGDVNQFPTHTYALPGNYSWTVVAKVGTASATNSGSIAIQIPPAVSMALGQGPSINLSWQQSVADVVMQQSDTLGAAAQWITVTNLPVTGLNNSTLNLPVTGVSRFFRVRQAW